MNKKRPYVLSIAGYDPSAGAGVLSDVKTFEKNKCYGMAVQTANTIQTEDEFHSINWVDESLMMDQLAAIMNRYSFKAVKIGLIKSIGQLNAIIDHKGMKDVRIVWDPVLSASAGVDFEQELDEVKEVLSKLYLITPNRAEVKKLSKQIEEFEGAKQLAQKTAVLMTSGDVKNDQGKDFFFKQDLYRAYNPKNNNCLPKHGSGCVFSSAITANIARGYPLHKAILKGKRYVENYLSSSKTLLGHHH